ncbi:DNA polymerase alpha catalytic subunit [Brachionus plicatilis]|uniref:DNA polymerase n=1 Tax=Brachionus plicatilis TaxID=10195 RepID=A0A3M7R6H2_BRAPC|nr:DNA polymerase alpha catalytic subunit [Brachionus plicatilis]
MDVDSDTPRNRNKKLNDKKLSALEKLKKARQGEKVEDDEEEEEEIYDYVEEYDEDYYEGDYSGKKGSKNRHRNDDHDQKAKKHSRKNIAKDKLSNIAEDEPDPKNDIRNAFFRASASSSKSKPEKKSEASMMENDDDLANEIMQELSKKSTRTPKLKATHTPSRSNIPFSSIVNTGISLSPAFKRKLSPSASNRNEEKRCSKKIELDDNLVQQLLETDSCDSDIKIINEPNKTETKENFLPVKSEPIEFDSSIIPADNLNIKEEKISVEEQNAERLSQLSLEANNSNLAHHLNLPIKQESNALDDFDLKTLMKNQSSSSRMLFYWLDAFEDVYSHTGTVYMFGKMPIAKVQNESQTSENFLTFVSVCCIVKNIPKCVHVLPRKFKRGSGSEAVTMDQVRQEIEFLLEKNRISSYRINVVKKNYAFDRRGGNKLDEEIPYESEYLQVEYFQNQHSNRQLPIDIQGEYFSCIFGANTPYLEHLLIDLKIKGPSWLLVSNAKRRDSEAGSGSMLSWCKLEYIIENFRNISVYHETVSLENPKIPLPPTPPLTILTLVLRTTLNHKTHEHEIVSACGLICQKFYLEKPTIPSSMKTQKTAIYDSYFCAVTKPSHVIFPYDFQNVVKLNVQKFRIEQCGSERALLAFLLCKMQALDVDIIVGHDLFGTNLDIILNRCMVNKVPHWSRLGRLKRSTMPNLPGHFKRGTHNSTANNLAIQQRIQTVFSGRLLCDIMISAKELLSKCKSFDLNELVSHVLYKKDKSSILERDYEEEKNVAAFYANSQLLIKFLQLAMMDATYILNIFNDLQCLQLAYQITCIAGNVLSRTLTGGRSERNEYLLLHAFNDKDFILPEKYSGYAKSSRQNAKPVKSVANKSLAKSEMSTNQTQEEMEDEMLSRMALEDDEDMPSSTNNTTLVKLEKVEPKNTHNTNSNSYQGGLVLDPKIGFYDKFILLLDFNSLYPSIIQEFNICFTTISRPTNELAETDIDEYLENFIKVPALDEKQGILPMEIRKLVDSRRQVKQLMQEKNLSPDLKMQYDIRQKALKLTANSVYGCLGFENSRFYCKPLAALITKNGRSILMKTKELVENKKIEVIYGDTDSIMINTNLTDYDQVIKLGNMIKSEVNKLYRHMEIDIDGVYKCLLLLRKKKYAALTIVGRNPKDMSLQCQQEIKGLDVVRRDWCLLAKQIGEKVIGEILSGNQFDQVLSNINKILTETGERIKKNSYDLSLFEISKQLNRNPEDYSDANHQPHVLVALRHNKDSNNSKKYKSGDVVSYIVCEDGTQNSSTQRSYSKSELFRNSDNLKLDTKYYLTQQVHPVVTRLCEPIEGIDAYQIAQSLGLDPNGFRHKNSASNSGSTIAIPQLSKQQKKIENFMNELEKYSNCLPFRFICPECKTESNWTSSFVKSNDVIKQEPVDVKMEADDDDDIKLEGTSIIISDTKKASNPKIKCILESCENPECTFKPLSKLAYIKNLITLQLGKFIRQYYQGWLVCEDPMCSFRTKRISCKYFHGKPQCVECERYATCMEFSHSDLYYQMKFFKFIFDHEAYKNCFKDDLIDVTNLIRNNKELEKALNQLKEHVHKKLKNNSFGIVNLTQLFKFF